MSKDENATFLNHLELSDVVYAVFSDHYGGSDFHLTKRECENRLQTLENRGASYDQTQKAINTWPPERV